VSGEGGHELIPSVSVTGVERLDPASWNGPQGVYEYCGPELLWEASACHMFLESLDMSNWVFVTIELVLRIVAEHCRHWVDLISAKQIVSNGHQKTLGPILLQTLELDDTNRFGLNIWILN
jgi:hypothetical protein